MFRDHIGS